MSIVNQIPGDVEQDRLRQADELAAECGKDWAQDFRPGTSGCHELLDRTAIFAGMIEQHIQTHPACVANAEWFHLAGQAAAALQELYQQIGAEHLSSQEPT